MLLAIMFNAAWFLVTYDSSHCRSGSIEFGPECRLWALTNPEATTAAESGIS